MAPFKPVKLLDQCRVAPPPGFVTPTCTALTFFDIHWLPLPPVELLYFYDFPYPISQFTHSLLPRLKQSLSCTLIHFYPFSGNLSWPHEPNQPIISFTEGDSVSFTVAEYDADFYHLSSNHLKEAIESRPLVPHLPASGPIVPMLATQVTVFPNTGICIAAVFPHSICDGRSINHFMRTWASISKLGAAESLPFCDRTAIKKNDEITNKFLDELDRFMGSKSMSGNRSLRVMDMELQPNMVRASFEISEASGRRLKEWVFAQYKKDERLTHPKPVPPSRLLVICAYTWVCLLKAEAKVGETKTNNMTRFVLNVDCRGRLDPPIPETYFGNCIRPYAVIAEKTYLMRGGVDVATRLISDKIHEVNKGVMRGIEHSVSDLLELQSSRDLAAGGSPQFGFYKTDFGLGRPKKVEMASIDRTGAMFLKESSNLDGGIEFDLVLSRKEMGAFVSVFFDGLNALSFDGLNALSEHSLCPSAPRSLL